MKDIKFAHWIKLKDAGSMLMPTGPRAGFEASAVYIRKLGLCGLNLM